MKILKLKYVKNTKTLIEKKNYLCPKSKIEVIY